MEYRRMGRTGLKVSEVCLGTMTFGHSTDEQEAQRIVDLAFDAGINFFDTADSYGGGESEVLTGKALKGRRRDAVIATKFFNPMGLGPNDSGMSRVRIMNAVEDSLQRLQTDYIDLYYIHHVDTQTPLEEMLRALDDLVRQGKVRYTACSNYQAWRLMEALWIADANGLARFECYQPQYSLVVRDIEQELIPVCQLKGLGVVVWSPLGGGFLSGKYKPGERTLEGTRSADEWAYPQSYFAANADETLQTLLAVADEMGRSPAQVALCAGCWNNRLSPRSSLAYALSSRRGTTCSLAAFLCRTKPAPGSTKSPTSRIATQRLWKRTCTSAATTRSICRCWSDG